MRRIIKQTEPELLTQERADGNSYAGLRSATRQAMQSQLCEEQGYLCCFCESAIEPDGAVMKIAHFVPQSYDRSLALTWCNLFGACYGNDPRPAKSDSESIGRHPDPSADPELHCDAKQGPLRLDDRLRPDLLAADLLRFKPDGTIDSVDLDLSQELHAKLNLNLRLLVHNRIKALDELIAAERATKIPAAELIQRVPDDHGRLSAYLSFLLAMTTG